MGRGIYVAAPVMLLLALLQAAALPRFPIAGVVPQLSFLIALSWGMIQGPNEGSLWAFVAGFTLDLFSAGPLGATSLAYIVAIMAAIGIARALPANRLVSPLLLAMAATPIYVLSYQLLLQLLGRGVDEAKFIASPVSLVTLSLLHAGLFFPIHWSILFVQRFVRPRPVVI